VRSHWTLDRNIAFLNHGSFGATPRVVLAAQQELRAELEREPVHFYDRVAPGRLDTALEALGAFLDAPADCLGFVTNATEGVHAVIRSTPFSPGDEIISTAHAYDAIANLLRHTASRLGLRVRFIDIALPFDADQFAASIESEITERTRLIVVDHFTSISAIIYPVERIVRFARERGIDTCIDGAHAPGMLDLSLRALGATYYTGNCHKWICAPKGAGFLYVDPEKRGGIHPNTISNHYGRGFHDEFAWQGTRDITPWLCVPAAIEFMDSLRWDRIRDHNRTLTLWAKSMLCKAWGATPVASPEFIGSMATLPLPDTLKSFAQIDRFEASRIMYERFGIEVPFMNVNGRRMLRISCQVYNAPDEYQRLRDAVAAVESETASIWAATQPGLGR